MAQLPCISLSWPLTNPPFGGCATYFHCGVSQTTSSLSWGFSATSQFTQMMAFIETSESSRFFWWSLQHEIRSTAQTVTFRDFFLNTTTFQWLHTNHKQPTNQPTNQPNKPNQPTNQPTNHTFLQKITASAAIRVASSGSSRSQHAKPTFRVALATNRASPAGTAWKKGHFVYHLGVSKNRGTPKWMVYNGGPYENW